jgi:hypothetical protein
MSLINFYSQIKQSKKYNPNFDEHHLEIPMRLIVCTASGGGKTNFVTNILYELNNTLHKLIIITKAEEPLYTLLVKRLKNRVEIYYEGQIPEFERLDKDKNGLIIFDDMVLTPNTKIGEIFLRGRKLNYSSIFITQSFYKTDSIIRQNINYIALGKGINKRNLRMILSEYAINITLDELESLYFELTKEPMNFMMIDLVARNIRHNIKDIVKIF